jgi:pyruvate ferredoxin oxidoreductase beta subunit
MASQAMCVSKNNSTKPKPVGDYLKLQGRFKHLGAAQVEEIQKQADRQYEALVWMTSKGQEKGEKA